jgi:quercetin dioxygenase-like cupin family protein
MKLTQFVTTTEGGSHFETIDIPITIEREGAGGFILTTSDPFESGAVTFVSLPADLDQDWHPAPTRQFVQVLSGSVEVTTSDMETRRFGAGDLFIAGDTTGQGHRTRVIDGPALVIFIPVPTRAFREQAG